MANILQGGFRCIGSAYGSGVPPEMRGEVASSYATSIYQGDPVTFTTDGTLIISPNTGAVGPVGIATSFSRIISGVRENTPYWPASTVSGTTTVGSVGASYINFVPALPGLLFEVQADEASTFATIATNMGALGENCDMVAAAGDTVTGVTGTLLDISTHAVTATLPWKLVQVVDRGDNDPTVTRFSFIVTPNVSWWTTLLGI